MNLAISAILCACAVPALVSGTLAFAGASHHDATWRARLTPDARASRRRWRSRRLLALSLAALWINLAVPPVLESVGVGPVIAQCLAIAGVCPLDVIG